MEKRDVVVDPMNTSFARIMEIFTLIGILVMLIFGVLYIVGLNSYVNTYETITHWGLPANQFWEEIKGIHLKGYIFLKHLNAMDSLSMLGIAILALAPLFSIIGSFLKTDKKIYKALLTVLILEFAFAVVRPLIMAGGGH